MEILKICSNPLLLAEISNRPLLFDCGNMMPAFPAVDRSKRNSKHFGQFRLGDEHLLAHAFYQ